MSGNGNVSVLDWTAVRINAGRTHYISVPSALQAYAYRGMRSKCTGPPPMSKNTVECCLEALDFLIDWATGARNWVHLTIMGWNDSDATTLLPGMPCPEMANACRMIATIAHSSDRVNGMLSWQLVAQLTTLKQRVSKGTRYQRD